MAFKFNILIISFIIVADSISGQNQDKAINDAYQLAVGNNDGLSESRFIEFLGEENVQHFNEYWANESVSRDEEGMISLEEFKNIINWICEQRDIHYKEFLDEFTQNINTPKALQGTYIYVRQHYVIKEGEGVSKAVFLDFVGKNENLESVEDYWTTNSVSLIEQDKIFLEDFKELIYWICKNQDIPVIEFLEMRTKNMVLAHETISEAYLFARRRFVLNHVEGLNKYQFMEFVGEKNAKYVENYWITNGSVLLDEFKKLVYAICLPQDFFVYDFLHKRMKLITNNPNLTVKIIL